MLKTIHRNNKFHILFPLILVMGGLSACGNASSPSSFEMEELTDTSTPSTDAQKVSSSFDASVQLQFLAQHVDLWTSQEDPYVDFYNYAVTDLNQNGWLELISTV